MNSFITNFFLLISFLFLMAGCRNVTDSYRIRPVSDPVVIEDQFGPMPQLPDFRYMINKNGEHWNYPAREAMSATSTASNGDTTYFIKIDNSFTRNDTVFKDRLELTLSHVTEFKSEFTFGSEGDAKGVYYAGNQYHPEIWMVTDTSNNSTSRVFFSHLSKTRNRCNIYLTTAGQYNTFNGSIDFLLK